MDKQIVVDMVQVEQVLVVIEQEQEFLLDLEHLQQLL